MSSGAKNADWQCVALRGRSPRRTRGAPSFPSCPDILGLVPNHCASPCVIVIARAKD
jgi:hypothetical protein